MATSHRLLTGAAAAALGLVLIPLATASPAGAASDQSLRYVERTLLALEGSADGDVVEELAERLDAGTSRRTIVAERVAGDTYQDATVDELYAEILGRAPSDADRTYWNDRLAVVGEYRVRAELLSAGELIGSLGGSKSAFVEAVYRYGLDRGASDADEAYWSARTGDTAASRSQVAWWVLRSAEGRGIVARDLFEEVLARTPAAAARDFYASRLTVAKGIESVTVTLAASAEAFAEAQRQDSLLVLLDGNTVATVDSVSLSPEDEVTFAETSGANTQLGITPGTSLIGIDVRPHTQVLYGLGSDGQLYSLNLGSATAAKIGAPIAGLAGDVVGFDFNPTVDRLRISTTTGENLRINPDTGGVAATDGALAYAAGDRNEGATPSVNAAAYTNSARGELGTALPASTVLYDLDEATDSLVRQDPPNAGTLVTVGKGLGTAVEGAAAGFDISPDTGRSWAVMADDDGIATFRLDLTSGRAIRQRSLPFDGTVLGLAVAPEAAAASGQGWLLSSALAGTHSVTAVDLADPDTALATLTITGVNPATSLTGLDVRNATGMPHVLGSDGQLYVLGAPKAATPTTVPAEKVGMPIVEAITLGGAGFDFNPAADRLRILVGTTNLRVNPNNGALVDGDPGTPGVQPDGVLAYGVGDPGSGGDVDVTAGAYTNAPRGGVAASTVLYDVESAADALVRQDPPNAGTLVTVGELGETLGDDGGFDIQSGTGTAYLVTTDGAATDVRIVDLQSGATSLVGPAPAIAGVAGFTTT